MEVGESSGRKRGLLDPYHPSKAYSSRTEPICADGEGNQLSQANFLKTSSCASPHASYTDSVVACAQSSSGAGLHMKMQDQVEFTSAVASIGGDSAGTCAKPTAVTVSDLEGVTFSDLLAQAEAASIHFIEGKPNSARKPVTPKPAQPKENPTLKFKSVRKKGLNKASTPPPTETHTTPNTPLANINTPGANSAKNWKRKGVVMTTDSVVACAQSSSGAGLHMKMQDQAEFTSAVASIGGDSAGTCAKPTAVTVSDLEGVTFSDLLAQAEAASIHFIEGKPNSARKPVTPKPAQPKENPTLKFKSVRKKGLNKASTPPPTETHTAPNTPLANINTPGANSAKNWKRKVVVMTTQDGHEKSETQSSKNNSNSSKTGNLTTGLHMGGNKRKHSSTTEHADISHMNLIGVHYNGLHAYQRRCVQFPAVQKKRRIDNPVTFEATDGATHDRSQAFESLISFSQTRPTKRRSKAPTKLRDFATLTFTRNCSILPNQFTRQRRNSYMQTLVDGERPITSIDTLVAENIHASFKKKRSTRENRKKRAISTFASTTQMDHDFLLNGCQPSRTMSSDTASNMQKMEALTEKFRHLHINVRASSSHELKALIPYKQKNQKGMITQGDSAIIPYEGSFDPIRKRLPRPKVDLDGETDKVWKPLMIDINSQGIDGTDEEKTKWWEEERRVFRGRADSFIARMHLVQGDRRFSQWKGSVVDSVVGVFLTQNVSDHLSRYYASLMNGTFINQSLTPDEDNGSDQNPSVIVGQLPLPLPSNTTPAEENEQKRLEANSGIVTCEPIIEEPATPERECTQILENDIEDAFYEDTCEIPTIKLNIEELILNLQNYMQENMKLQGGMSKALVALNPEDRVESTSAAFDLSFGMEHDKQSEDQVESTSAVTSIGGDSAGTCAKPTAVAISDLEGVSFSDLLTLADAAASIHFKEGKPNSARKAVTPKPAQPKENPTLKFKYVRKKGLNKASTPPPTEVIDHAWIY
ncbi:hypothetical protein K1719_031827 [Acacia pycnantha]|nr:hypothetical protein K1719_031827 [Acacia pycnantha]